MPDSIKISDLTLLEQVDLSVNDQLVINNKDTSSNQVITHHTELGYLLGFITSQQLTFSKDVEFSGDVNYSGNLSFSGPISLTGTITITSPGKIEGLTLGSLDDVEVNVKNDNDALFWDATNGKWIPKQVPNSDAFYTKAEVDALLATAVVFGDTEPSDPRGGQFWMNTTTNILYAYDASTGNFVSTRPDALLIGDNL